MLRGGGKNAAHLRAAILQTPDQIERFIGGNAAADDKQHAIAARFDCGSPLPFRPRWRLEFFQNVGAGRVCGFAQDDANLVLHGAAMTRRTQAQKRLQFIVELPDSQAAHGNFLCSIRG